jgi:NADP-dependent 3-hydroxy acid dehydrogenase YdfG
MMVDLNGTNVRIVNIDPGLVETEFAYVRFQGNKDEARKVYEGYQPLAAKDVAEIALFAASRPPHVCMQDILVTPTDQATAMIVNRK